MTSRKNLKTTGKTRRNASEQSTGGIRKFFQRLCIYGLTLIGMLLIYFVMGGDSRELAGIKNSGENPGETPNGGVSHSVGKPVMDANGNPVYQNVSEGGDMYGYGADEMMSGSGSSGYETTLDPDLAAELGLPDSTPKESSENAGTSGTSGTSETQGSSENAESSGTSETSGASENSDSGSKPEASPMVGNSDSSGYSSDASGYSSGSSSDYSSDSSGYSSGSSSDYSSGSSSDYSSNSSGYSSGYPDYSSSSSSNYSGSSSTDSPSGLNADTSSSGPTARASKESLEDFFPKTPPLKDYKEGVVTGPDGNPRRNEVKILEVGRGKPMKNHYGPAVTDFLDLFDFSITPDWVEANWSSVAIVGPLTTRGYRVPISTGPEPSDLVGSLTYYFDSHLELEKITFEGYTGDLDRLLISLKYFNMTKRITSDPSALLYLSEELPGNRRSFLKSYFRLQSHDESEPNKRYWITIELYPPEK